MSCDEKKSLRKVVVPEVVLDNGLIPNPAFQVEEDSKNESIEQKFSALEHSRVWDMLPLSDIQRDNLLKEFELLKKKNATENKTNNQPISPITQLREEAPSSQTDDEEYAELDQLAQSLCLDNVSETD